jgi:single-strand DNA-binding protein
MDMAGSINKVILIGNVGKDPEIYRLQNGSIKATFSMATSETYTDKETGERKEITDWHDIVLWRRLAEITEKYVRKGYKVYVEGKLKKRSYQDKEGNTRYAIDIVADEMTILSKPENSSSSTPQSPYSSEGLPAQPSPLDDQLDANNPDEILPF